MSRLKKRCFAGSLAAHGALLLVLVFGSAFFASRDQKEEVEQVIEMVNLTDGRTITTHPSESASVPAPVEPPRVTPAPTHPEPPVHHVQPPSKPVASPPAKEEEEPAPASDQGTLPKPPSKPKAVKKEPGRKSAPIKPTRELGPLVPITSANSAKTSRESSQTRAQDESRREAAKAIGEARNLIAKETSSIGEITMPGEVGRAAFANYTAEIYRVYKAAFADEALQAGEFATEELSVTVSVTISRGGDVTEGRLVSHSGSSQMDRLVRRVLAKIKFVAPFPSAAKDSERTFEIQFNLKPNGTLG